MTGGNGGRVDRRTTLKWMAATMAASCAGCHGEDRRLGEEIPDRPSAGLLGTAAAPAAEGYGADPRLIDPTLPWPLTLTAAQREAAAALCDVILPADERTPAASAVGVPDFIDEWVSAPYPRQQEDRALILEGLEWLERESRERFGTGFAAAAAGERDALVAAIAEDAPQAAHGQGVFFRRFRYLAVGAFYTTEAGSADIGYLGNVPIQGDYPGPTEEAMAHLAGVLDTLGLSLTA